MHLVPLLALCWFSILYLWTPVFSVIFASLPIFFGSLTCHSSARWGFQDVCIRSTFHNMYMYSILTESRSDRSWRVPPHANADSNLTGISGRFNLSRSYFSRNAHFFSFILYVRIALEPGHCVSRQQHPRDERGIYSNRPITWALCFEDDLVIVPKCIDATTANASSFEQYHARMPPNNP